MPCIDFPAFDLMSNIMQVGEKTFMKLRDPLEDEYYLQGPGTTLVVELVEQDECNAH
ncbi:TPA: hypothetical protein RY449_001765 [Escherichia albertii]|nr:hypothetical protein [Escherichia albertii]HEB1164739.1 hypothetical protein [Escherichia albertii]HEB1501828.1 hypothetical protein [Escherichia albertii]HEB1518380.1 hypothetical protein [Escherichia albertii]HEB1559691.1 hypothetical protein [Escherichia albertii]